MCSLRLSKASNSSSYKMLRYSMLPSSKMDGAHKSISGPEGSFQMAEQESKWSGSRRLEEYMPPNSTIVEEKVI